MNLSLYTSSFFLSLAFLFVLHASAASLSTWRDTDTQLLISFKNSLSNPTILTNWNPSKNPCEFSCIVCKGTRVFSIELSSVPLSTDFHHVASTLLKLESLETLSLRSTNLSGTISMPPGSKCGALLGSLDLSQNSLSGPLSDLSNFVSCSGLKSLNLSSNLFDFSVKDAATDLSLELQVLDLSFNKISGHNVVSWIFPGGCGDLRHFSLKGNKISGDVNILGCRKLEYLDLSMNNISLDVPSFGDCSALKHLDISANKFNGDVGRALSACGELTFLNLSSNQFSGRIPAFHGDNLKFLSLAHNHFHGEIPQSLTKACESLVELDLSSNNLSGIVPSNLGSCSSLESIDLSSNDFFGEFPVGTLMELRNLKKLALSDNSFFGTIPDTLSELPTLEVLDLSSNNFSGPIPASLCQDPKNSLKTLYLQNNMFKGSIPARLSNCSQLVSVDLSFNYLTGTIPPSFGSLLKLRDLIIWMNQLHGEIPQELMNIKSLENLILDFNELTGPIPSGLSNCNNLNWISLSNNRLTGEIPAWIGQLSNLAILKLSNNSLSGRIPPELGDCRSLIWLDLNSNQLNGSIPPDLFKQSGNIEVHFISTGRKYAYIKNDGSKECHGAGNLLEFEGIRQEQLTRISTRNPCNFTRVYGGKMMPTFSHNGSMIFLDLSHNMLSGSIPKEVGTGNYLFILNLGYNKLSGLIPEEIGDLKTLGILDLSGNKLEGIIPPSMAGLSQIVEVDLSNNFLSGRIPESTQFDTFPAYRFANNSGLCGMPLPQCGSDSASSANAEQQKSHPKHTSLVGSVAMGLLFALFCIFGLIIIAIETRKRRKQKENVEASVDGHSHSTTLNFSNWKLTGNREALSINLATFEKPLKKLTLADLVEATNGFHNDSLIGSGGFGDVYKANLKDGSVVAVKKLIHVSGQGDREFTAEMETIGKIKHRNLVPLLGYCKVGEERLLVYECMKHGSLEDVLHNQKKGSVKLNWSARRKIAIGSARGLAFLHHNCIPHIIHRDMKSSNVLLDDNLEARVSDFGMARLMSAMDTHLSVSTLAGTPGYVPPEYYQSFRCSTKGDVYSYGVVLLELLTGRRPTDSTDFGDNNIVGWVKQHAKLRISDVFDPELMREDPTLEIELLQHLKVACACLDDRPLRRPTMIQVMAMFKEIQAGGSELDSTSSVATIATEDDGFGMMEMVDMTIKEVPEMSKQ